LSLTTQHCVRNSCIGTLDRSGNRSTSQLVYLILGVTGDLNEVRNKCSLWCQVINQRRRIYKRRKTERAVVERKKRTIEGTGWMRSYQRGKVGKRQHGWKVQPSHLTEKGRNEAAMNHCASLRMNTNRNDGRNSLEIP
jgi:hypothetical protein